MKKIIFLFIAFTFTSYSIHAQIDSLLGVYDIDSCHFDNICPLLYTDTAQNPLWETGVPAKPFFDSAYTPPYALCTRLTTPYDTNALASFELRIPNYMFTNMIVGFRHKYQTDTLTDGGYIEVSYDHGQSWINAIYDTTYLIYHTENFYTLQDTLAGGIHGFSGTSAGWVHSRIQWVWAMLVKDIPDTLYMRFTFKSDAIQTNKAGWMIDNLVVSFADMPGFLPKLNPEIDITVYPNPFSTSTYILLPETYRKTAIINLYDLSGKHLQKINSYQNRLCILQRNNLKSGTYILHVNVPGHQSLYKKIIIE